MGLLVSKEVKPRAKADEGTGSAGSAICWHKLEISYWPNEQNKYSAPKGPQWQQNEDDKKHLPSVMVYIDYQPDRV